MPATHVPRNPITTATAIMPIKIVVRWTLCTSTPSSCKSARQPSDCIYFTSSDFIVMPCAQPRNFARQLLKRRAGLNEPAPPVLLRRSLCLGRLRGLLHIGLLARINSGRDGIAVRLDQVLALVHVLRPLGAALVVVLLALVYVLVHRIAALLHILVRLLLALCVELVRLVTRLQCACHKIIASLFAGLRRIQHTDKRANPEARKKPTKPTCVAIVLRH